MKDRLKKKEEKRKRELIHQILDVVLDINGLGARDKEITGSLPTAFFEFNGHIGTVDARLYRTGWESGCYFDSRLPHIHTNNTEKLERAVLALKAETPGAATPRVSSN